MAAFIKVIVIGLLFGVPVHRAGAEEPTPLKRVVTALDAIARDLKGHLVHGPGKATYVDTNRALAALEKLIDPVTGFRLEAREKPNGRLHIETRKHFNPEHPLDSSLGFDAFVKRRDCAPEESKVVCRFSHFDKDTSLTFEVRGQAVVLVKLKHEFPPEDMGGM